MENVGLVICKIIIISSLCGIGALIGKLILLLKYGVIYKEDEDEDWNIN